VFAKRWGGRGLETWSFLAPSCFFWLALQHGEFTLASGKTSYYYLDCRKVTLDSRGANLIATEILKRLNPWPDAVGGLAIGADPITASVITLADERLEHGKARSLKGFIVRKEAKQHGTGRDVEGPVQKGNKVFILEDVITSGSSSLLAIQKAEAFGLTWIWLRCFV